MNVQPQRYGLEPDDDASEYSEALVVNISNEEVIFKIATTPGSKARRYRLAPYGQAGSSVHLQDGYTKEYKGAGREVIKPIIEALTRREAYPGGPSLALVVHEEKAPAARRAWLAAFEKREADIAKAQSIELKVSPDQLRAALPKAAKAAPVVAEDFGNDEIEPPHPDDDPIIADGPPSAAQLGASMPDANDIADHEPPRKGRGR